MSRGLHAKYKLLNINDDIAYYAYGGSNFNYEYDKNIFDSCDGRMQIKFNNIYRDIDIAKELELKNVEIVKPCYYAENNIYGVDILALKTIHHIINRYIKENQLPENGMWVI